MILSDALYSIQKIGTCCRTLLWHGGVAGIDVLFTDIIFTARPVGTTETTIREDHTWLEGCSFITQPWHYEA